MRSAISMGQFLTRFFSETAAFVKKSAHSKPIKCVFQGLKWRKFPDVIRTDRQTDRQKTHYYNPLEHGTEG